MGRLVNKADVMARTALASVEDVRNRKTGVVCSRASPSEARPVWLLRLWFITERGRLAAPGFFEAEQTAPAHIAPGPCFIPLFHAARVSLMASLPPATTGPTAPPCKIKAL